LAEAASVRVLSPVAADAIAWQLILQIAAAMALLAVDSRMLAFEGEAGLLLVIELGGLPARHGVARATLVSALAAVHVIGRVTGDAFLRCSFVSVPQVTGDAGDVAMLLLKGESSLRVIEAGVMPHSGVVACSAIRSQFPLMGVFLPVAVHASGRRLAVRAAGDMTARARQTGVGPE
jgi:hypothetical protein